MDGIASTLRRKEWDEEIDRWSWLVRVLIIPLEILARPENIKFLLADRDVGSRPTSICEGRAQRLVRGTISVLEWAWRPMAVANMGMATMPKRR